MAMCLLWVEDLFFTITGGCIFNGTIMKPTNKLATLVCKINRYPLFLHSPLLSLFFGWVIKFAGTAKVRVEQLDFTTARLRLKNRRRVQNHIGSVHATATALLGESASGFLVGMHIADHKIPLLKSMHIDYIKRSQGDLCAIATLSEEQIRLLKDTDKGEITVKVIITDAVNNQPVDCEFVWAWILKRGKV